MKIKSTIVTSFMLVVALSLGMVGVSVVSPALPRAVADERVQTQPVVEDGVYVITSALDNKKAVDVNGAPKKNGANVQLWDRNDGNAQRFRVTHIEGNQYSIVNEYSGKSLDIDGGSKRAGANVQQWSWNDSDNQRFIVEPVNSGGYTIKAVSSGLFLDVKGSRMANGSNVIQWKGKSRSNQHWNFNAYDVSLLYSSDARARELEEGLTLVDQIPESVLLARDDALARWIGENGTVVQTRASFWGCTAALASLIGGNLVGASKLLKIKQYMNALGGVKEAVYLMWKCGFAKEKLNAAGGALGALAAEILGVKAVREECFR